LFKRYNFQIFIIFKL